MKKILLGVIALIMINGTIVVNTTKAHAAKEYCINISKTSPKIAERKLAKVKPGNKQKIYLKIKSNSKKRQGLI